MAKAYYSTVFERPAPEIWNIIRDFNNYAVWVNGDGESEANLLHEFSNRGLRHGLTDLGREQAGLLAEALAGVSAVRLFSSPLLRAVQTAELVGARRYKTYRIYEKRIGPPVGLGD